MKTSPLDFLLSAVALGLILVCACAIAAWVVTPLSIRFFGDYHVIADSLLFLLSFGLLAALLTRILLVVRPLRSGNYSMDDPIFVYWKLLTVIYEFGRGALLPFTTVFARPLVAALFGAKVGGNAALGGRIVDPPLVVIADGAVFGLNSVLAPHTITSGRIILGTVRVGRGATVGVGVVVMAGVEIGDGAVVAAGSVLPPFTKVPAGELWGGAPARKIKVIEPTDLRG